ncbi:MAG TPA: SigE family RNA polymerase sigma factor [Actinomycetota bacterium]|nr:SigE family RNA polymerase sigma factor [Actinomycetota bacterium]
MAGRDEEFREFFDAEFRPLRRLAYLLTGDWGEAEDLAQETMVRMYRAWSRIQDRERPAAYARTVLVNRHRSLLRRARVETKHAVARHPDIATPAIEMGEDALVVWRALHELPVRERQVLVLRFYEDMPIAEIAEVLGIPIGTVKSLTHRAVGRLRERLGDTFGKVVLIDE